MGIGGQGTGWVGSVMVGVWLPGMMAMPSQWQGAQVEKLRSSPRCRICKASIPRATVFDYNDIISFSNDIIL